MVFSYDPGQAPVRIETKILDVPGKVCRRLWTTAGFIEQIYPVILLHARPEVSLVQRSRISKNLHISIEFITKCFMQSIVQTPGQMMVVNQVKSITPNHNWDRSNTKIIMKLGRVLAELFAQAPGMHLYLGFTNCKLGW